MSACRIDKATTSPVPGTTLSLLKFPIMRPDPGKLAMRYSRLKKDRQVLNEYERERLENLRRYRTAKYAIPFHPVGQTFAIRRDQTLPYFRNTGFDMNPQRIPRRLPKQLARFNPDDPAYTNNKWCYDTPGTVSEDQIINLLTQEEVMTVLSQNPIRPRTYLIKVSGCRNITFETCHIRVSLSSGQVSAWQSATLLPR